MLGLVHVFNGSGLENVENFIENLHFPVIVGSSM
jgi:hypothetical protein